MITRIAPTPSGYLHAGNCVNFLLIDGIARASGGEVVLRIDDMDADRYRAQYVDDVFRILEWLDISWQRGPRSRVEFEEHYSMRERTEYYREAVFGAVGPVDTYACSCSRAEIRATGSSGCVSNCMVRALPWRPGESALRVHVPPGTTVDVNGTPVDLAEAMGDFVLWRRDDRPSYQAASVIEDRDLGVTHVIRGEDLLPSTAAQLYIAPSLGAETFAQATFVHHALVRLPDGEKLSKSQLTDGPMPTSDQELDRVKALAASTAAALGISPAAARGQV